MDLGNFNHIMEGILGKAIIRAIDDQDVLVVFTELHKDPLFDKSPEYRQRVLDQILIVAVAHDREGVAFNLIENGANPNVFSAGMNAFALALDLGFNDIIPTLLMTKYPIEASIFERIAWMQSIDPDLNSQILNRAYHDRRVNVPRYPKSRRPITPMIGMSSQNLCHLRRLNLPLDITTGNDERLEMWLPVVRYPGIYYGNAGEEYCGTFYYYEPESSNFLFLGKTLVAATKYDALVKLQALYDDVSEAEIESLGINDSSDVGGGRDYAIDPEHEMLIWMQTPEFLDFASVVYYFTHRHHNQPEIKSLLDALDSQRVGNLKYPFVIRHQPFSEDLVVWLKQLQRQMRTIVDISPQSAREETLPKSENVTIEHEDQGDHGGDRTPLGRIPALADEEGRRGSWDEMSLYYRVNDGEYLDPEYLGQELFAIFDTTDQTICQLAELLGFDTIILQREPGQRRVVTEILDVRPRQVSYKSICHDEEHKMAPYSTDENILWYPSTGFLVAR